MKRLEKRIRALEADLLPKPVILYLPDGTPRTIYGRGDFLYRLFIDACKGSDMSPRRAADLDLIRQSVSSKEPNGGRMVDLIRCFLLGPAEEPSEPWLSQDRRTPLGGAGNLVIGTGCLV